MKDEQLPHYAQEDDYHYSFAPHSTSSIISQMNLLPLPPLLCFHSIMDIARASALVDAAGMMLMCYLFK
jgi:hypothetical protein